MHSHDHLEHVHRRRLLSARRRDAGYRATVLEHDREWSRCPCRMLANAATALCEILLSRGPHHVFEWLAVHQREQIFKPAPSSLELQAQLQQQLRIDIQQRTQGSDGDARSVRGAALPMWAATTTSRLRRLRLSSDLN